MKNRLRFAAIAMAAAVPLTVLTAGAAQATNIGQEGCTPGYWKNHTENWEEYTPNTLLSSPRLFPALAGTRFGSMTLLEGLQLKGGPGFDGAMQIMLRAASAAVLNAAHEGVGYPYRRFVVGAGADAFRIIREVEAVLASGDRAKILALADKFDAANNLDCPL
jgi:hypothetical protein